MYWGCKRFYLYFIGIEFVILTEPKPLVFILGTSRSPRLQGLSAGFYNYSSTVTLLRIFRAKANWADILSHTPVPDDATMRVVTEDCVCSDANMYSFALGTIPEASVQSDVEKASAEDETLQIVRECIKSGDWKRLTGILYMATEDELWIIGQIIMHVKSIILPEKLWEHAIKLAHEGPHCIVRTKSRLREKVWWPNIDKQVESFIKACHLCLIMARQQRPEPMI